MKRWAAGHQALHNALDSHINEHARREVMLQYIADTRETARSERAAWEIAALDGKKYRDPFARSRHVGAQASCLPAVGAGRAAHTPPL
jgi:hypothetical protein